MQLVNLLAQASETVTDTEKINQVYEMMTGKLGFQTLIVLAAVSTVLCIVIFMRQKKIAQNQVDLAKVMEQILEKK